MSFEASNKKQDESGRILILYKKVSDSGFLAIMINLYNTSDESEQLNTLSTLCNLLDDISDLHCKNVILGEDFNVVFNVTCEARGGNPKMKNKSVAKFIRMKESLGFCDIWRVRNPNKKRYAFRQHHVTGFIQRRLNYFLISNASQESINKTNILTALETDHSPRFFSLPKNIDILTGKVLRKFNNPLCHKLDFVPELKNQLKVIYNRMSAEKITDEQLCWEYIKYEIRKFSTHFSNKSAKKSACRNCDLRK